MRASKRRVLGAVVAAAAAVGSLGVATATPASANHAPPGRLCHALAEENPLLFALTFGPGPGAHGRCAQTVAHLHDEFDAEHSGR